MGDVEREVDKCGQWIKNMKQRVWPWKALGACRGPFGELPKHCSPNEFASHMWKKELIVIKAREDKDHDATAVPYAADIAFTHNMEVDFTNLAKDETGTGPKTKKRSRSPTSVATKLF